MLDKSRPLTGFRCWYCGRPLDQRTHWVLLEEQFYCNALCREADEHGATGTDDGEPARSLR